MTQSNDPTKLLNQEIEDIDETTPPAVSDELSISGSTTDPEADDDTLLTAQTMGIAPDADEENPDELNMAKNIQDAERRRYEK